MERLAFRGRVAGKHEASAAKKLKAVMDFPVLVVLVFTVPFPFIGLVCSNLLSLI